MPEDKGPVILAIARAAISEALGLSLNGFTPYRNSFLLEKAACFVTLKINGALRGCVGSLEAHRPLFEDICANAVAAALHDPRFPPMKAGELGKVRIEVSLLSPLQRLEAGSEQEATAALEPGRDGVVFQYGDQKATFLPQVWEQLPDTWQFLAQLRLKAGLPADFWDPDVLIYRYKVDKFTEKDPI